MIDNKVVGQAISQLRQAENMTQQTLAACLNVSHQAVSKWENGAALPDVLTLLEISRMFGVTLEQLLAGDIQNRLEKRTDSPQAPAGSRVIELKIDGNGLSDRVNDALKGAEDAVEGKEDMKEEKTEKKAEEEAPIDMDKIIQMAPYMSRAALEELLEKYSGKCTPKQLSRLAPYVSSERLERLIVNSESEINWETLRRLAPFLKKEVVDTLTMAVAKGEKYARPAAKTLSKSITFGINKALELAKSVSAQMNGDSFNVTVTKTGTPTSPDSSKAPGRASEARKRIFERALADNKFDWIAAHTDQLEDTALKSKIAARARELGMYDWIKENMGDMWDQATIDDALLNGNWDYIAAHLSEIDADTLEAIVTTALGEGKWDWLGEYLDEMDLPLGIVASIATTAAKDSRWDWLGEHLDEMDLPLEIVASIATTAAKDSRWDWLGEYLDEMDLPLEDVVSIINVATEAGQWDWLGDHIDEMELIEEAYDSIALAAANAGQWDWLSNHIDELELSESLDGLAAKGYQASARDFVIELIDEHADDMNLDALIDMAIEKEDMAFIEEIIKHADTEVANAACLKLAHTGHLDRAAALAENCDEDTVATLIEIATEGGDWDVIEILNEYLD